MPPSVHLRDILDFSPAEISVINMAEGSHQHEIVYINKTKADQFGLDADSVVGKKCYQVFEPLRESSEGAPLPCGGCPSLQAFSDTNQVVHRDWCYIHPKRNEIRFANITSRRIPDSDFIIEICRDNTIRKRIWELTSQLASVESYPQIEEIIFTGFLKWLYFDRCRFYRISSDGKVLVLKSFKKGVPVAGKSHERELIDIQLGDLILTKENSIADKSLLENNDLNPKLFYISDLVHSEAVPQSQYRQAILLRECEFSTALQKRRYPIWLDLPITTSGKIIGKISVDMDPQRRELDGWGIADYEIESLVLFVRAIGQAWENVRLLDVGELRKLDQIVWVSKSTDLGQVLPQVLVRTSSYLGFEHSHIGIDSGDGAVMLVGREIDNKSNIRLVSVGESLCGYCIEKYKKDHDDRPMIFDPITAEIWHQYKEIGGRDTSENRAVKSCLVVPIIDDDNALVGAWYLESDRRQVFNEYLTDRIQVIAPELAATVRRVQRDKELELQRDRAVKSQKEAEQNLEEKERFYQTAQHELLAPIDPIASTFKLFKRKIEHLGIKDKRLLQLADEGMTHCQFLRFTFDNFDFLRSEPIFLDLSESQIFKEVIIPVVETVREFAREQGVQIEYSGYQIVEKYITLDVNRMRNVFFNLLRNAIKYSNRGSTIYVRGVKVTEGVSLIEVENRGIGIPEGWEERIFNLYQRADNARKLTTPGSGIGLYISRKIIHRHGGRLFLQKRHEPTIFAIEIPKYSGAAHEHRMD